MEKERLDIILVDRGYFPTREKARGSIMAGVVFVNNEKVDKSGTKFAADCSIEIKENINPYVSRGGLKLEKAIKTFNLDLNGKTAIDIGASTGGFTDCMLKNGAIKVFAIDVGYGQLAWELRNDPRVVCMERTNIRYVKPEDLKTYADFASIDVAFISLKKVIPVAYQLISPQGEMVCLIKPQFEAGREKVEKHGVVRDPAVHEAVICNIISFSIETGFSIQGLSFSPIKGPEGNIEYLLYISKDSSKLGIDDPFAAAKRIVQESHSSL
ncbi:MAG: hemolysin [Clostridiales bacterium]|nr:hemolysin [Clostridiales bacterium]